MDGLERAPRKAVSPVDGVLKIETSGKNLPAELWTFDDDVQGWEDVIAPCIDTDGTGAQRFATGTGSIKHNDNDLFGDGRRGNASRIQVEAQLRDTAGGSWRFVDYDRATVPAHQDYPVREDREYGLFPMQSAIGRCGSALAAKPHRPRVRRRTPERRSGVRRRIRGVVSMAPAPALAPGAPSPASVSALGRWRSTGARTGGSKEAENRFDDLPTMNTHETAGYTLALGAARSPGTSSKGPRLERPRLDAASLWAKWAPLPEHSVRVPRRSYSPNFGDPWRRIAVKVGGLAHHHGQDSFVKDQQRQRDLSGSSPGVPVPSGTRPLLRRAAPPSPGRRRRGTPATPRSSSPPPRRYGPLTRQQPNPAAAPSTGACAAHRMPRAPPDPHRRRGIASFAG